MVDLPSKREDEIRNPIYPGLRQGIFAGATKFDQVIKLNKKSGKQFYADLDAIINDCTNYLKIAERFEFTPKDVSVYMKVSKFASDLNARPKTTHVIKSCMKVKK